MKFRNLETGEVYIGIVDPMDRYIRSITRKSGKSKDKCKLKEDNMDKPRICEVLGVEVNERVYYKDPNGETVTFFINEDGSATWVFESGKPLSQYGIGYAIAQAINHPDRIIRKPRFTEQEVEDAKNILRLFGKETWTHIFREVDGEIYIADSPVDDPCIGYCSIGLMNHLFPSIQPGQSATLDEIIGGRP